MSTPIPPALNNGRRIDVHQHVILPEYLRALERSGAMANRPADGMDGLGGELVSREFTPESASRILGELGMAAAVLTPFSSAGIHHGNDRHAAYLTKTTNEAAARFISDASATFGFYAILPLPDVDAALQQLEEAFDTLHADGVGFLTTQHGIYMGDRAYEELYAEMDRRAAIAFVHPGRPVHSTHTTLWPPLIEFPFETTRVAVNLIYNGILARFPNITWILAHAGGTLPYLSQRLKSLLRAQDSAVPSFADRMPEGVMPYIARFYYDTAIAGATAPMAALAAVTEPSHILYGSDWPYMPPTDIWEQVDQLGRMSQFQGRRLDAMERNNAAGLFKRFGHLAGTG
jgi:predicted TIM-barrel fold metal-dependent hydrolase